MKVSTDYYMPSTLLEQSISKNGTNIVTFITENSVKESESLKLFDKSINVVSSRMNCWNEFRNIHVPKMINQSDFGKLIKYFDKVAKGTIDDMMKTLSKETKILSVHTCRTGSLGLRDQNVWLLDNCFYGKRKSIIKLKDKLYEFPKTGTFYEDELNCIGEK